MVKWWWWGGWKATEEWLISTDDDCDWIVNPEKKSFEFHSNSVVVASTVHLGPISGNEEKKRTNLE